MIAALHIDDPTRTIIPWWSKVTALQGVTTWHFTPGLNILWGPNGSGKTSIVLALAKLTHCAQGGTPAITRSSVEPFLDPERTPDGVWLEQDGQPVVHVDPGRMAGIVGGGFDDDFFDAGLKNILAKGSAGQLSTFRWNEIMRAGPPAEVVDSLGTCVNDLWLEAKARAVQSLAATIPKGPRTILMDEPDRSIDLPAQATFWKSLTHPKVPQVIVATHSPFAVDILGANYIELEPGYLEKCRAVLREMFAP